jgi:hypothetical protein
MTLQRQVEPVVVVFRVKDKQPRMKGSQARKPSEHKSSQPFTFVNASGIGEMNEKSNRLVKTHAAHHVYRRRKSHKLDQKTDVACTSWKPTDSGVHDRQKASYRTHSPRSMLSPNCFILPIQHEPYMPRLINGCTCSNSNPCQGAETNAVMIRRSVDTSCRP